MKHKKQIYLISNRLFDILFSLLFILISLPIQLIIFIVLIFEIREFPIFLQERALTLESKRFKIFKFKTIKSIPHTTQEHNIFLKTKLEKYIGPFSRLLRKTGLDELPQLYNVLFGTMSLIGPRPFMITDLELMKRQYPHHYAVRSMFNAKPGISGLWQLFGIREEGIDNLIELEKLYEINRSILLDFKLLLFTFASILKERNSDAILANIQKQNKVPTSITITLDNNKFRFQRRRTFNLLKSLDNDSDSFSIEIPENYWDYNTSVNKSKSNSSKQNKLRIIKIDKKTGS